MDSGGPFGGTTPLYIKVESLTLLYHINKDNKYKKKTNERPFNIRNVIGLAPVNA
jgi:hypothetical protein